MTLETVAPTRIDLAGGTLDIWPISQIVPAALTVNLAIELRARVLVEPRDDGRLAIVSRDRQRRTTLRLPLKGAVPAGPLSWIVRLASAFDLGGGASIVVSAEAPAGGGLGGSSALGVALGAALARFTGERLAKDALVRRVQNLETREIAVPTGDQDYLAAVHGGLNAWRYTPDGTVREPIASPEDG